MKCIYDYIQDYISWVTNFFEKKPTKFYLQNGKVFDGIDNVAMVAQQTRRTKFSYNKDQCGLWLI